MKILNIRSLISFLILTVIIYSILIIVGDYQKISEELMTLNLWIIPAVMFFAWLDDFIRFFKWDYYLRRLNIKIPKKLSFFIFFSGLSMSITPGKIGEVLKSYLLKKARGIKMRKSVMVVVFERLTDVLGLAILALLGAFTFINNSYFLVLISILISLLFIAFMMLSSKRVFLKLSKILVKIPFVKKYVKYINNIFKTSKSLLSVKVLAFSTLISVVSWFSECFGFYILMQALGSPIPILTAMFIFSFSSIFGSIIFLPGGLGASEGSFVALLLFVGVSLATASLATILIRLCTLFWGIFIGIVSLTLLNRMIETSMRRK